MQDVNFDQERIGWNRSEGTPERKIGMVFSLVAGGNKIIFGNEPKWWNWQTHGVQGAAPTKRAGSNPAFGSFYRRLRYLQKATPREAAGAAGKKQSERFSLTFQVFIDLKFSLKFLNSGLIAADGIYILCQGPLA